MPKDIEKEIKKYTGLERLKNNKDGQILISYLKDGLITEIDTLLMEYRNGNINTLTPIIARIDERLAILRLLTKAENNKELWLDILEENKEREL